MSKVKLYGALICGFGFGSMLFASDTLAIVNGQEITKDDVNAFIKANQPVNLNLTYDKLRAENKRQIIGGLIDNELMVEAAKKANIQEMEDYKKELKNAQKALLIKYWLKKQFDNMIVSDSEAKKFYEKVKMSPEQVHARHILVKTEAEAKKIISTLKNLKGDALKKKFIELAKKKSVGPSAPSGGDLGYFTKDKMVPSFGEAAFSIKKGHISTKPVKSQFGWHVIFVEDHKASKEIPFDKLKDKIIQDLKQKKFKEKVEKDLEALRKQAEIKVLDKDVKGLVQKDKQESKKSSK
jgi:parvulin-like peptidyl-prolyl isomerase